VVGVGGGDVCGVVRPGDATVTVGAAAFATVAFGPVTGTVMVPNVVAVDALVADFLVVFVECAPVRLVAARFFAFVLAETSRVLACARVEVEDPPDARVVVGLVCTREAPPEQAANTAMSVVSPPTVQTLRTPEPVMTGSYVSVAPGAFDASSRDDCSRISRSQNDDWKPTEGGT